jgi:hypothetical protein
MTKLEITNHIRSSKIHSDDPCNLTIIIGDFGARAFQHTVLDIYIYRTNSMYMNLK